MDNKLTFEFISPTRNLLSEEIYEAIKKAILDGTIKQGERLKEMIIARQFKTSQTPVREAFKKLQQDKLIKVISFKGAFVEEVKKKEIPEIYQLRITLEKTSLEWFIAKMRKEDIEELTSIVEMMEKASVENDISLLVEQDSYFHKFICMKADFKNLYPMWLLIYGKVKLIMSKLDIKYNNMKEIIDLHKQLLEAIKSRDLKLVMDKYDEHAKYAYKALEQNMRIKLLGNVKTWIKG